MLKLLISRSPLTVLRVYKSSWYEYSYIYSSEFSVYSLKLNTPGSFIELPGDSRQLRYQHVSKTLKFSDD